MFIGKFNETVVIKHSVLAKLVKISGHIASYGRGIYIHLYGGTVDCSNFKEKNTAMANVKIKFMPPALADGEGLVSYLIVHDRKVRQIISGYALYAAEWNDRRSTVVPGAVPGRAEHTTEVRIGIERDVERIRRIVMDFDSRGRDYTADDIVEEYERHVREYTVFAYMAKLADKHLRNGRVRTAETYRAALASFSHFRRGRDVLLDSLSADTVESYEAWMRARGITPNTMSFYNRILRAAYNRAVEEGITENRSPFRHVYTGVDKTHKRALPIEAIKRIKELDLSRTPALDFARKMFMMSFYLRGMSFIDMAYLRKADMVGSHIVYRRRKTGQQLEIAWTKEMQAIIDEYPAADNPYLLPIIRTKQADPRNAYRNAGYTINRNLKKIAAMAGIEMPLTMYVARHSWASAAQAKGIPLSIISEGMGHDSEATTRIYLASLDTSLVDKANSLILSSL